MFYLIAAGASEAGEQVQQKEKVRNKMQKLLYPH